MTKYLYEGELTKDKLEASLRILFPGNVATYVKVPGTQYHSDFKIGTLIIDFYDPTHFRSYEEQMRDDRIQEIWETLGYTYTAIPYFVQLDSDTIQYYFGLETEYEAPVKHGFHKGGILPRDFNREGFDRFWQHIIVDLPEKINDDVFFSMEAGIDYSDSDL